MNRKVTTAAGRLGYLMYRTIGVRRYAYALHISTAELQNSDRALIARRVWDARRHFREMIADMQRLGL